MTTGSHVKTRFFQAEKQILLTTNLQLLNQPFLVALSCLDQDILHFQFLHKHVCKK